MKNIISILIAFLLVSNIYSQDSKSLHLLMYSSEDLSTQFWDPRAEKEIDSTLVGVLWRVEADTLVALDTLNYISKPTRTQIMRTCRHFDEQQWIYILEKEYLPLKFYYNVESDNSIKEETFISVLDYSGDSIIIRRLLGSKYPPFNESTRYEDAFYQSNLLYYEFSFDVNQNHYGDFIISKYLNDGQDCEKEVFIDSFYVKNEAGLFHRYNRFYMIRKDNQIKKTVYEKNKYSSLEDWPENEMNIPISIHDNRNYTRFEFLLKTPQNKYIIGRKNRKKQNPSDYELYYVFNKESSIWDTIYLPNEVKNFNIYNDQFLYGTLWKDKSNCLGYESIRDSVLTLIKKYPKKYSWRYSHFPNLTKSSGKLFIYDLENNIYKEFYTADWDSEFLQIIDNWIYYRDFDKIIKMKLNEKGQLFDESSMSLIIQDHEVIPNVHHIFLKEKCEIKELRLSEKKY